MAALPLTGTALHKAEMEYHGKFGHTIGSIQHTNLISRIDMFTQPVVYQPKLWHLRFLISKVSIYVFNIWLVTHINQYFFLLILMMDQMSSDLHGMGINLKSKQPRIV